MVEQEADDALAAAAGRAAESKEVERAFICSPDKDLGQCVQDDRVVQLIRRTGKVLDEPAIVEKFGVGPASIPDYLALVGDSADGYPGLAGWGAKSAATVLSRFGTIEAIPAKASEWELPLRGSVDLAHTLREQRDLALLFKDLATLRTDADVFAAVKDLRWRQPREEFAAFCERNDAPQLMERANALAKVRST
jgi:5'-3' exonuclease